MSKNKTIISLIALTIVGSLITFYANNLLMSIICNGSVISPIAFAAIPFYMICFDFIAATILVVRMYKHKENKKALMKHYSLLVFIFSVIGFVSAFLVGQFVYDSFIKGPFTGYSAILMASNLLIGVLAALTRFFIVPKTAEDKEPSKKMNFKYIMYTILLSLSIYYAFNKFGAILFMPVYVQTRTLYMTWVFYLALASPIFVLFFDLIHSTGLLELEKKSLKICAIIVLASVLMINVAVVIAGFGNSQFVAAVSFAVPLERLGSKPFDALFRPILSILMGVELLVKAFKK